MAGEALAGVRQLRSRRDQRHRPYPLAEVELLARSFRAGGGRVAGHAEALVEIGADRFLQVFHAVFEEVVGVGDHGVLDRDAFLGLQFLDQRLHFLERRDPILVAVNEQAGRRAGGEEAEVEAVGGRGDRDEAFDFRPPHQQLHADPRAERDAGDPAGARLGADRLRPVERGSRVGELALAVVECALRPADAAKIEAQRREPAFGERVIGVVDDLIVHRPAELGMRVEHHRDRRAALLGGVEAAFQPSGGTVEKDLRHRVSKDHSSPRGAAATACPPSRRRRRLARRPPST